jgi:hypothetical protein
MWFRNRRDEGFSAEIQSHLRLEIDRLMAEGMPPAEAAAAARRAFGNVTLIEEKFYESQRWMWLDQLGQDLRPVQFFGGGRELRNPVPRQGPRIHRRRSLDDCPWSWPL